METVNFKFSIGKALLPLLFILFFNVFFVFFNSTQFEKKYAPRCMLFDKEFQKISNFEEKGIYFEIIGNSRAILVKNTPAYFIIKNSINNSINNTNTNKNTNTNANTNTTIPLAILMKYKKRNLFSTSSAIVFASKPSSASFFSFDRNEIIYIPNKFFEGIEKIVYRKLNSNQNYTITIHVVSPFTLTRGTSSLFWKEFPNYEVNFQTQIDTIRVRAFFNKCGPAFDYSQPWIDPLLEHRFQNCAIVASGHKMLNSNYGFEIDSHELIMRFNWAPIHITKDNSRDVGNKTNIVLVNIHHLGDEDLIKPLMNKYLSSTGMLFLEIKSLPDYRKLLQYQAIWPGRVFGMSVYWFKLADQIIDDPTIKTIKTTSIRSLGFAGILMAYGACETVNTYGFGSDNSGFDHYFGNQRKGFDCHDFLAERKIQKMFATTPTLPLKVFNWHYIASNFTIRN
eukprot:TRINITY_DN2665_c0_g1_i1.p1 TRINITY_DN2665_c0_g1~~TRINITY_DN2665_c0_g1_i1.p1  ORF type:complete len:452 (+),score=169.67 TRINITY_DN2665_c0_g1_i1:37-1392(+)